MTNIARDRASVIGSPLKGSRWVDVNGCCAGPNSHRQAVNPINGAFYVSERFAIDFAQLTVDKRLVQGDPEQLASYPSYGADLISVGTRCRGSNPGRHRRQSCRWAACHRSPSRPSAATTSWSTSERVTSRSTHTCSRAASRVRVGDRVTQGQVSRSAGQQRQLRLPAPAFPRDRLTITAGLRRAPLRIHLLRAATAHSRTVEEVLTGGVAIFDPALSGPHSHQLPLDLQVINFPTRHDNR